MLGILLAEKRERVDGIARLRHAKLHIARPEMIMIRYCELHHSQAVKLMDKGLLFFEGVLGTHHKPDFIEIGPVIERICNDQVTDMDRIEAPKVQSDLHFYFAKKSDTKSTASAEARSKSSFKMLMSNCGSKVISNLAL